MYAYTRLRTHVTKTGCLATREIREKSGNFILHEKSWKRQGNLYKNIDAQSKQEKVLKMDHLWL